MTKRELQAALDEAHAALRRIRDCAYYKTNAANIERMGKPDAHFALGQIQAASSHALGLPYEYEAP